MQKSGCLLEWCGSYQLKIFPARIISDLFLEYSSSLYSLGPFGPRNIIMTGVTLFMGQVPVWVDEMQILEVICQVTPRELILQLWVLRSPETKQHRGCAFVRVRDMDVAQNIIAKLNNVHKFHAAQAPVQVSVASKQRVVTPKHEEPCPPMPLLYQPIYIYVPVIHFPIVWQYY